MQRSPRFSERDNEYDAAVGLYDVDTADRVERTRKLESMSPAFKTSSDRNPYPVTSKTPGAGRYDIAASKSTRLAHCIDGTERSPPGYAFGARIPDTPSPVDTAGDPSNPRRARIRGGYMARDGRRRPATDSPEETPGPVAYAVESSLFKPSLNVTYSMGKL